MLQVQSGLDIFEDNLEKYIKKSQKIAVLCHAASVNSKLVHIIDVLFKNKFPPSVIFAPEHGIFGAAQDMENVCNERFSGWNIPIKSLYGNSLETLQPSDETVEESDLLICDLQDIGSRYYTYVWTIYLATKKYLNQNKKVIILDRPNPITGKYVEGNLPAHTHLSFVGLKPIPNRHALTIGELMNFLFQSNKNLTIIQNKNWKRSMWFDETGLPWVMPSPNMPNLDTAILYPGLCLLEGTNISEGRGTTRPFEIIGAPFINAKILSEQINTVESNIFARPLKFKPKFQKYSNTTCEGVQLHIIDRNNLNSYKLGLKIISIIMKFWKKNFKWRSETYEFVTDIPAFNLLTGNDEIANQLENGLAPKQIDDMNGVNPEIWFEKTEQYLFYNN